MDYIISLLENTIYKKTYNIVFKFINIFSQIYWYISFSFNIIKKKLVKVII